MVVNEGLLPSGDGRGSELDELRHQYRANLSKLERLREEVLYSLNATLSRRQIKTHSISGRVKTVDSFLDKVDRKAYQDPFSQIQDLVGVRVVGLFLSDLDGITEAISETFDVLETDDHGVGSSVDTFGYMSLHYICRLGGNHAGPRYHALSDLDFEIQVRTIVMDAWANISHQLAYKNETGIPDELRRDFHALSGLFYVADQHFELFSKQISQSQVSAERAIEADEADELAINVETVIALLREMFPERGRGDRETIAEFVDVVRSIEYETIGQLKTDILAGLERALRNEQRDHIDYLKERVPGSLFYKDIGIAREALSCSNHKYSQINNGVVER